LRALQWEMKEHVNAGYSDSDSYKFLVAAKFIKKNS
jgi:hypothetical protein